MSPELEPDRAWEQYDRSLAEYRFQVDVNWKRSEYFFVLNVAMLVAAVTLLGSDKVPPGINAAVFGAGAVLAVLSIVANYVQHGYYRSARALKARIEADLVPADLAIATTPGMGSGVKRLGRVRTFLTIMLIGFVAIDIAGIVVSLSESSGSSRRGEAIIEACGRTIRLMDADDVRVSCPP